MRMNLSAAISVIILCVAASAAEPQAYPPIPKQFIQGVYRIRTTPATGGILLGTGVGVDLPGAKPEKRARFLLTCAHVVLGKDPKTDKVVGSVDVEVIVDRMVHWETAEVVAVDVSRDLCLIKIGRDLPFISKLAEKDVLEVGDAVLAVGFPEGTVATPSLGYLTAKYQDLILGNGFYSDKFWQASMPVVGGDSGGAVFDPNRNVLIGIIQACLLVPGSGSTTAPAANVSYFIPLSSIKAFIDGAAKKISK